MTAAHDPAQLAEAFELDAKKGEDQLKQIWRDAVSRDSGKKDVVFKAGDPDRPLQFNGLEVPEIPSTPDILVADGVGLGVFLRHEKDKGPENTPILPTRGLGSHRDRPAVMSYGRAVEMFPAQVLRKSGKVKQVVEPSREESLETTMGELTTEDQPKPMTEKDYRLAHGSPAPSILSEDEQGELFRAGRHMINAADLVRQYAKVGRGEVTSDRKRSQSRERPKRWGQRRRWHWWRYLQKVERCTQQAHEGSCREAEGMEAGRTL